MYLKNDQREAYFLGKSRKKPFYELTGVPCDELHELPKCVGFLHHHNPPGRLRLKVKEKMDIEVPCHVTGFGSPPRIPGLSSSKDRSIWEF